MSTDDERPEDEQSGDEAQPTGFGDPTAPPPAPPQPPSWARPTPSSSTYADPTYHEPSYGTSTPPAAPTQPIGTPPGAVPPPPGAAATPPPAGTTPYGGAPAAGPAPYGDPQGSLPPGTGYGDQGGYGSPAAYGAGYATPPAYASQGSNTSALVLTIASGISILFCGGLLAIPALVFGILGLTRQSSDPQSAQTMTRRGWWAFGIALVLTVVIIVGFFVVLFAVGGSGGFDTYDGYDSFDGY